MSPRSGGGGKLPPGFWGGGGFLIPNFLPYVRHCPDLPKLTRAR